MLTPFSVHTRTTLVWRPFGFDKLAHLTYFNLAWSRSLTSGHIQRDSDENESLKNHLGLVWSQVEARGFVHSQTGTKITAKRNTSRSDKGEPRAAKQLF